MANQLNCIIHPQKAKQYYAFRDDGILALYENGQREPIKEFHAVEQLLFYEEDKEKSLTYEKDYTIEIVWPWLSVFQQYGTTGCVFNLETESIRLFSRENYHADVSSFSNGLFIYKGHVCMLHQTQWNRLDVTDLETGDMLTHREIYYRYLDETDERGNKKHEEKNYKDYFHGKVYFSPDYRYFVDTGWVWQPAGVPILYCLEDFLKGYENSEIELRMSKEDPSYVYSDDWDQSVVWLDSHTFLLSFNPSSDLIEDADKSLENIQNRLLQFNVNDVRFDRTIGFKKQLMVDKTISSFFVPTQIKSYYLQHKEQYYAEMLNIDLYWDEKEQLMIGINDNELFILDRKNAINYCFRYGTSKCYYSVLHHMVYQLPGWSGCSCGNIRDLLNRVAGFRFEK